MKKAKIKDIPTIADRWRDYLPAFEAKLRTRVETDVDSFADSYCLAPWRIMLSKTMTLLNEYGWNEYDPEWTQANFFAMLQARVTDPLGLTFAIHEQKASLDLLKPCTELYARHMAGQETDDSLRTKLIELRLKYTVGYIPTILNAMQQTEPDKDAAETALAYLTAYATTKARMYGRNLQALADEHGTQANAERLHELASAIALLQTDRGLSPAALVALPAEAIKAMTAFLSAGNKPKDAPHKPETGVEDMQLEQGLPVTLSDGTRALMADPLESLMAAEANKEYAEMIDRFKGSLSKRELELFEIESALHANGETKKPLDADIAARMGVKVQNVGTYRHRIRAKFQKAATA